VEQKKTKFERSSRKNEVFGFSVKSRKFDKRREEKTITSKLQKAKIICGNRIFVLIKLYLGKQ